MSARTLFEFLFALTIATCLCVLSIRLGAQSSPAPKASLQPQPIATPGFPTPTKVVDGWVSAGDASAIRNHGWALWQGASAITPQTQGWPVWETWYTDTEVSAGPPGKTAATTQFSAIRGAGRPVNSFIELRQFRHARLSNRFASPLAGLSNGGEQVIGFNKFDADYSQFVWKQGYYIPANLWKLEGSWPANTPAAARMIQPFPAAAVGLKPVFDVVRGPGNSGGITVLPYWKGDLASGPLNSTDPAHPTPNTWKQCVVVNTGTGAPPPGITCPNGGTPTGTVGRDQFYNFQLSKAEAASICNIQPLPSPCSVQEGDYAVLVAMHMTTKEDANWTWQTFWWNYSQPFPYGPPPASVPAPFNHYAMCSAYSMTVNPVNSTSGKNVTCYNPYLETGLKGVNGVQSNCMTCHNVASFGTNANSNYPPFTKMSNFISPASPSDDITYYDCQTQTDFSWFMADLAGSPPASQPVCKVPAVVAAKQP